MQLVSMLFVIIVMMDFLHGQQTERLASCLPINVNRDKLRQMSNEDQEKHVNNVSFNFYVIQLTMKRSAAFLLRRPIIEPSVRKRTRPTSVFPPQTALISLIYLLIQSRFSVTRHR